MTADNSVFHYSNANDMRVTQDLNPFGEIIAHTQCSVVEQKIYIFRVYHTRIIAKKNGSHIYILHQIFQGKLFFTQIWCNIYICTAGDPLYMLLNNFSRDLM